MSKGNSLFLQRKSTSGDEVLDIAEMTTKDLECDTFIW